MAKPRKVIRTKTLYKKNILPPKVVGVILFLLLILFIVIIGFVLMHEMTVRFGDGNFADGNLDINGDNTVVEDVVDLTPESTTIVDEGINQFIDEFIDISKVAFIDSQTIASGKSAIEVSLASLIESDFTAVAFELKPYSGSLVYNSTVSQAVKYGALEVNNNFLSLDEIIEIAYEYEITPIAYMSTLQDQIAGHVLFDTGYAYSTYTTTNWLDNSVSAGGKSWVNPYMENSQEYISDLAIEMYKAGFMTIFLDNVIFPTQNTGMINTIKTTPSKEQILTDFVEIVEKAVPSATVFRIEDLTLTASIDDVAEGVSDVNYNTVLSRCETENIAVSMSLDNITNRKEQIILRENLSVDNKASSIEIFKELLEKTIAVLGENCTVVVTQKDFDEVKSVLDEFGIVNFVVTN